MSIVDRPVCDIEDTSLLDDITTVRNDMKNASDEVNKPEEEINSVEDSEEESINIENSPP